VYYSIVLLLSYNYQLVLAGIPTGVFCCARVEFYCLLIVAGGYYCIQIVENMLQFSTYTISVTVYHSCYF